MTTHEVETLLNITKQTLLYYEKENFIHPQRDENNYRNYSTKDIEQLRFIIILRSLTISIDEIKQILNQQLSIRECLETKQAFLKVSKEKLDTLTTKIEDYLKRIKVNIYTANTLNDTYPTVFINENTISFNNHIIPIKDIQYITISLCCSKGENGLYYSIYNLYFVCLDIYTIQDTYSLELMNNNRVPYFFTTLLDLHITCKDPMKIINAYQTYKDPVVLHNYFNRNFRNWSKQYHLPINGIHSVITNDYIKPLQQMKQKKVPSIKEQVKELKNIYIRMFKNIYRQIFKK